MTLSAWLSLGVFVSAYVLIATERFNRAAVALTGAAAMVLIGATRGHYVFYSEQTGIDWNVIFLLFGMMVIVGVLRTTGAFEYLAIRAVQAARGRPFRMLVLLSLLTAGASALLDNVTTILLVAPVTLLVADRLRIDPVPFLLAEVMASNIGGAATLIGDPPNLIIGSRANISFNDFLLNMGPIVLILLGVFLGLAWLLWGRSMSVDPERAEAVTKLRGRDMIQRPRLLLAMGALLVLVLLGFMTHSLHHIEPSLIALLGAGAAVLLSRTSPEEYLGEVEWETLVFFAGLFVMVGTLVHQGIVGQVATAATQALGDHYLAGATALLGGSAVLSAIIDNIPYVATMAPLVSELVGQAPGLPPEHVSLWWALALGADLGGNATAIGASANVVATGVARRNGHPISFWTFTKYGLVVTAVTIAIAIPWVWLRYFVLA